LKQRFGHPNRLHGSDLIDRVIDALRAVGIGVDSSTMRELGDADPEGEPDWYNYDGPLPSFPL
jgi:hypothetical protein